MKKKYKYIYKYRQKVYRTNAGIFHIAMARHSVDVYLRLVCSEIIMLAKNQEFYVHTAKSLVHTLFCVFVFGDQIMSEYSCDGATEMKINIVNRSKDGQTERERMTTKFVAKCKSFKHQINLHLGLEAILESSLTFDDGVCVHLSAACR